MVEIAAGSSKKLSSVNTSNDVLAAGASFTGQWELNDFDHLMVNCIADQDGTIFIEFGVLDYTNGAPVVAQTFPLPAGTGGRAVYTDTPFFRTIVKGRRAVRVRFVNGGTPQGSFHLSTSFGDNLFPVSASDDNETLVTVTERERDTFVAERRTDVAATAYAGFIDLSDTTNFPHDRTGRIDLTATFFSVDRSGSTATGSVRIGVITRIDGTDADITFVSGVSFNKSDDRAIIRDRQYSPSHLKCGVSGGALSRILSDFTESNVTAINTGIQLTGPLGLQWTPAVGDLIVKFTYAGTGTYDASVSAFYHSEFAA